MPTHTLRYFDYQHLPAPLQRVSRVLYCTAHKLEAMLLDGPEKATGMRKLLEAKDCFVRAAIDAPIPLPTPENDNPAACLVEALKKVDAITGNVSFDVTSVKLLVEELMNCREVAREALAEYEKAQGLCE